MRRRRLPCRANANETREPAATQRTCAGRDTARRDAAHAAEARVATRQAAATEAERDEASVLAGVSASETAEGRAGESYEDALAAAAGLGEGEGDGVGEGEGAGDGDDASVALAIGGDDEGAILADLCARHEHQGALPSDLISGSGVVYRVVVPRGHRLRIDADFNGGDTNSLVIRGVERQTLSGNASKGRHKRWTTANRCGHPIVYELRGVPQNGYMKGARSGSTLKFDDRPNHDDDYDEPRVEVRIERVGPGA